MEHTIIVHTDAMIDIIISRVNISQQPQSKNFTVGDTIKFIEYDFLTKTILSRVAFAEVINILNYRNEGVLKGKCVIMFKYTSHTTNSKSN